MTMKRWPHCVGLWLTAIVIAGSAQAALAPQFRWLPEFPLFVLEPDGAARNPRLRAVTIDVACTPACTATTHYDFESGAALRIMATLPIAPGAMPRVEAEGATVQLGPESSPPKAIVAPQPPAPIAGGETTPPRGRAQAATRMVTLSFNGGRARVSVTQPLNLGTQGATTDQVVQHLQVESETLASWPRAQDFTLRVEARVVPSAMLASAPRPLAAGCLSSPDRSSAQITTRAGESPDGSLHLRFRLDAVPPAFVECYMGAARTVEKKLY